MDRFGKELVEAGRRRCLERSKLQAAWDARLERAQRPVGSFARLRVGLLVLAVVFASTAITLAATGVILTGSPVRPVMKPIAATGQGIPVEGGARLLPLRASDPAGGLPWGMRVIHTTRGLICVQIGRVRDGQLGELGVDGAFHDDGRFHPLPADALPDVLGNFQGWMSGNCAAPGDIYAGDSVGLELSAASALPAGAGVAADRREISFGLLGTHAVSITYRSGAETHTEPVLPGLGAYLIVQRYRSGRPLGSVSETDGRDEPGNYSGPAGPNGAVTVITYSYAGRTCIDRGNLRLASCGLSEVPPPRPAALPSVHERPRVHLHVHGHLITAAEITFSAPYPVTSANESYDVSSRACGGVTGPDSDVARGATVKVSVEGLISRACTHSVLIEVQYDRFLNGALDSTPIGTVTIHEPPGTHAPSFRRPPRPGALPHAASSSYGKHTPVG